MNTAPVLVLNSTEVGHKIKRIAYQIYESNFDQEEVILAGILRSGFQLAERLKQELEVISPLRVQLCEVKIDKGNPLEPILTSLNPEEYSSKSVVLVDDVLNSGATLIYGVRHFLSVPLGQFRTAVLVDRSHKKYPVKADFKGISLSTSLHETVQVFFEPGADRVELI